VIEDLFNIINDARVCLRVSIYGFRLTVDDLRVSVDGFRFTMYGILLGA
jgi:hypothetical protein